MSADKMLFALEKVMDMSKDAEDKLQQQRLAAWDMVMSGTMSDPEVEAQWNEAVGKHYELLSLRDSLQRLEDQLTYELQVVLT